MANILDFSQTTMTPKGTDKMLVVGEDAYGHETLASVKDFINGDVPSRLTTAEGEIDTLQSDINAVSSRVTALENQHKIRWWGLDMNESTGAFTRIGSDVSLMTFTPAAETSDTEGPVKVTSGFDSLYPWCDIRQCKMDDNGHILAYYEDSWYSSVDGDYMTEIPLFYYAEFKVMVSGVKHHVMAVSGSDYATEELSSLYGEAVEGSKTFVPEKIFVQPNGTIVPHAYIARLIASSGYKSKPSVTPMVNISGNEVRTAMASKGDGKWCSYDAMARTMLVHLMAIEAGQFDVKKAYGQGVNNISFSWSKQNPITVATENQSYAIVANATANKWNVGLDVYLATSYSGSTYGGTITAIETYDSGNKKITLDCDPFTVTTDYDIHALQQTVKANEVDSFNGSSGWYKRGERPNSRSNVCYRGMWDLWGNLYQWIDGFMSGGPSSDYLYLCFDQSKYKNATSTPVGADGWINTQTNINLANGYQKTVGLTGGVHIPESLGGGAYTYVGAYAYYFASDSYWHSGVRLLVGGGYFNRGGDVSPLCVDGSYTPSGRDFRIASRFIRQNLGV